MNTNKDLDKSEASNLEPTENLELEGELLTEVCASESTLGIGGNIFEPFGYRY